MTFEARRGICLTYHAKTVFQGGNIIQSSILVLRWILCQCRLLLPRLLKNLVAEPAKRQRTRGSKSVANPLPLLLRVEDDLDLSDLPPDAVEVPISKRETIEKAKKPCDPALTTGPSTQFSDDTGHGSSDRFVPNWDIHNEDLLTDPEVSMQLVKHIATPGQNFVNAGIVDDSVKLQLFNHWAFWVLSCLNPLFVGIHASLIMIVSTIILLPWKNN